MTREREVLCQEIGCRRPTWRDDARCVEHAPTVDRVASSLPAVDPGEDAPSPRGASSPTS